MPSLLDLDDEVQAQILTQHTFYGLLQNPLASRRNGVHAASGLSSSPCLLCRG